MNLFHIAEMDLSVLGPIHETAVIYHCAFYRGAALG